ncbi:hypothetical protein PAPYR_12683 [Paratrimastix pyriformis]|uniref:Peptidase S74 domain-containing protein n=1 Tax=Paratrimastix pyriformis TaxID=342808 RepID=A0ABQ8U1G3_9EUKA|nr:hypothetical protein PAPYR_12683 [Paratrimastix pyriformis]
MADSSTSIQAAQLVLCPGASSAQITTSSNNPVKFPSGAIVSSLSVTGASDFVGDVVFHGNVALSQAPTMDLKLRQLTDVSIAADDTTDRRLMRYDTTLGKWVADITYDEAASSSTVVKRTANGTINAAVINASGSLVADTVSERTADHGVSVDGVTMRDGMVNASKLVTATVETTTPSLTDLNLNGVTVRGGNLTAQTLRLSGLASGDVYSTNGAITVVANRDRTGLEAFDNTPGYAFDASYHLSVESGTGWVAGKRFAWTPAVLNTDTTLGTPTHLTVGGDGALAITGDDSDSIWTGSVVLLTFLHTAARSYVTNDYLTTVDTSPLCMTALDHAVGTTLSPDFAATLTGTQLALSPYTLSYRGITIKSAAITNVTEIHNFAFTGGVWSVPQISTSIIARTSSGAQSTNYSVHLLGLMPCAAGPIVVDILSPNTFTSAPEAAISIDNRATSIQFVGSLAMLHVVPFMWVILQNATSVVASTYPIRPPSAPTREKLVLTMNDLSDSMFSINGGIGRIFRPDATRALVINSIASESYTTMSSALKLTYGGYTTGFVSRAADGVLSMTTGSSTATNSSIVLRDATGASAFTTLSTNGAATIGGILTVPSVASAGNLKLLLSGSNTTCGVYWGGSTAGSGLDGVGTPPSCAPLTLTGNCLRLKTGTSTAGTGLIVEDNSGAVNFAVNTSGASYSRGNHILGGTLTVGGTTSASLLGTDSTGLVVARTASINSVINTYALRAGDGSCGFHKVTGPVGSTLRLVLNGTDPNWGMYYSAVGATALNTNVYAPGCSQIGLTGPAIHLSTYNADSAGFVYESTSGTSGTTAVPQFAVNALTGNTYVNGTLTVNGSTLRLGNSPSATIASANKLNLESDYDQVVIGGDATSVLYNADVSNFGLVLRADGADAFRISKSRIVSPVILATNLGSSGDAVDVRIDSDGRLGMAPSAAKYKTDIVDMQDTSAIYQLHPVNFHYKADANRTKCYGLIADEAFTVCPDLVRMKDGEVEGLYEHKLPFMMLNELQKLHTTVTEQRVTIASLQAQVDDLRSGMAALLELVKSKLQ